MEGSGRFFYFDDVRTGDSLFLETMKVLYGEHLSAKTLRPRKPEFLKQFRQDGFYLIDSTDVPLGPVSDSEKRRQIRRALPSLKGKVQELSTGATGIILVSKNVYEVCCNYLRDAGFEVLNDEMLDFPGSGGARKYKDKMGGLLRRIGWRSSEAGQ